MNHAAAMGPTGRAAGDAPTLCGIGVSVIRVDGDARVHSRKAHHRRCKYRLFTVQPTEFARRVEDP
jgi:hypothetical protein